MKNRYVSFLLNLFGVNVPFLYILKTLENHRFCDNFQSHNSLKLSFTNIRGLRSNFGECESLLESNYPDILAVCETNMDVSTDSGNFYVRGNLPLIRRGSITHMHDLTVLQDLSLENSVHS